MLSIWSTCLESWKLLNKNFDKLKLSTKIQHIINAYVGTASRKDLFQVTHININTLKTCYQEVIGTYISTQH